VRAKKQKMEVGAKESWKKGWRKKKGEEHEVLAVSKKKNKNGGIEHGGYYGANHALEWGRNRAGGREKWVNGRLAGK